MPIFFDTCITLVFQEVRVQNDENSDIVRLRNLLRSSAAPTPVSSFGPAIGPTSGTELNILPPVSDQAVMTSGEHLAMLQRKKNSKEPPLLRPLQKVKRLSDRPAWAQFA